MSINCKDTSFEKVLTFLEEIDATGKKDGYPRNPYLPNTLRQLKIWKFCDLEKEEFSKLIVPNEYKNLLKDEKELNSYSRKLLEKIENGEELPPLVIREKLPHDPQDGSYYIEDGAHRAIALWWFFKKHPYVLVKTYIGTN